MTLKKTASTFLTMVTEGDVQEAYDEFVAHDFIHHNPYFKGDRQSLLIAMSDAAKQNPDSIFEIMHLYETQDTVISHGWFRFKEGDPGYAVVHIMKFKGEKIVEMWDLGQAIDPKLPNENGMF